MQHSQESQAATSPPDGKAAKQLLRDLHTMVGELAETRQELARAPLQLKARQADLANREATVKAQQDACKRLRMNADQQELALKTGEEKVRNLKVRLNTAQSNKEYSTLQEEIKNFSEANGTLEEEILNLITQYEEEVKKTKKLQGEFEETKKEFAKFKEMIEYRVEKFTSRVKMLEEKARACEEGLQPALRDEYRRLAKIRGEGNALTACVDGVCQACHTGQTPQKWHDVIAGRMVHCVSCGAMLYQS